jgi:hypothetical protein
MFTVYFEIDALVEEAEVVRDGLGILPGSR